MNAVSFVICAAGEGQRMKIISQDRPKHLLSLNGKTLLEWSLSSLPFKSGDQLIFIVRKNCDLGGKTKQILKNIARDRALDLSIHEISHNTTGQAATALLARPLVKNKRLVLFNSDTYFECELLDCAIHEHSFGGIAPCFKTRGEEWSFFKTGTSGPYFSVTDVAEKKRISDWCSTGLYFFNNAEIFFDCAAKELEHNTQGTEFYIAPLYQKLLPQIEVKVLDCEAFKPMGTPEQVFEFWGLTVNEFKRQNGI